MRFAKKLNSVSVESKIGGGGIASWPRSQDQEWIANDYLGTLARFRDSGPETALSGVSWVHGLHAGVTSRLRVEDRILGLASGLGEHEFLLMQAGWTVAASDTHAKTVDAAQQLWQGRLPFLQLDALSAEGLLAASAGYDVILVTGLDPYLNELQFARLMDNLALFLNSDKSGNRRVILCLRYIDNPLTKFIDSVMNPVDQAVLNIVYSIRGDSNRAIRNPHGYRRSVSEVRKQASRSGLKEIGAPALAGIGLELQRSPILNRLARFFPVLARLRWNHSIAILTWSR